MRFEGYAPVGPIDQCIPLPKLFRKNGLDVPQENPAAVGMHREVGNDVLRGRDGPGANGRRKMRRTMGKRVAGGLVVLSAVLSMNIGASNAGIIGQDIRLTSGARGIDLLVVTNVFSPKLADFMLRAGWLR